MIKIWKIVHSLENFLLVVFIGLVILFSAGQIIIRNIFEQSYPFVDPLIRHLVLMTGMWGALVAAREDKNLRIEIGHFTTKSVKKVIGLIRPSISFIVCSLLTYHAVRFVADEYFYGVIAFASLPSWCVQLIFPIVFLFLTIRFLIQSIKAVQDI
ncbi:MAG: TRAP transporter small permease subunit [Candidatus Latescibacterota bacterium]|nr:TRAP transporter small permease subunit [Candidatus Latescibacterota bacterium]